MQLSLEQAKEILKHTLAEQGKKGFKPMAVVVLGAGGGIKASESQDGTERVGLIIQQLYIVGNS